MPLFRALILQMQIYLIWGLSITLFVFILKLTCVCKLNHFGQVGNFIILETIFTCSSKWFPMIWGKERIKSSLYHYNCIFSCISQFRYMLTPVFQAKNDIFQSSCMIDDTKQNKTKYRIYPCIMHTFFSQILSLKSRCALYTEPFVFMR